MSRGSTLRHAQTAATWVSLCNSMLKLGGISRSSAILGSDSPQSNNRKDNSFDTVNHEILLDKLKHYRLFGNSLNWFRSYFKNRTQMACINGSVSDPLIITTGAPQGSILGPLLFTFYMKDLPKCLQHSKTNMYADDTAIRVSASDKASVTSLSSCRMTISM